MSPDELENAAHSSPTPSPPAKPARRSAKKTSSSQQEPVKQNSSGSCLCNALLILAVATLLAIHLIPPLLQVRSQLLAQIPTKVSLLFCLSLSANQYYLTQPTEGLECDGRIESGALASLLPRTRDWEEWYGHISRSKPLSCYENRELVMND